MQPQVVELLHVRQRHLDVAEFLFEVDKFLCVRFESFASNAFTQARVNLAEGGVPFVDAAANAPAIDRWQRTPQRHQQRQQRHRQNDQPFNQ